MKELFQFLNQLKANNNREWFNNHKEHFIEVEKQFKNLVNSLEDGLSNVDTIYRKQTKIYRIYRDVRFSNDKTPFHLHRSVSFKRDTHQLRGGYYLKIKPSESAIVGGFFGPNAQDILHIRKQIQQSPEELFRILESDDVTTYFSGLEGEKLKSAPRGFSKNDPAIELLRFKQFLLKKTFTDKEVLSPNFCLEVVNGFKKMRPFFDYMSEILTTDLNGVSLLED